MQLGISFLLLYSKIMQLNFCVCICELYRIFLPRCFLFVIDLNYSRFTKCQSFFNDMIVMGLRITICIPFLFCGGGGEWRKVEREREGGREKWGGFYGSSTSCIISRQKNKKKFEFFYKKQKQTTNVYYLNSNLFAWILQPY